MRVKGAKGRKLKRGQIFPYIQYIIPSCYIYIYTALYASQTKLWTLVNVCICWQQILVNMWPFGMSFYSFKSLIAICHNMFVNCDAINVLDYQISLIEKKKNWLFWIKVVIFIDKYKHHFVMLFSLMKFFDLHWKSMKIDEIGALWLMVKQ